jgi:heat shock protein HslJ
MAATDLDNSSWKLVSYFDGNGDTPHALPADVEVTLTFQGGAAGGHSACNRYRGDVTVGEDTLVFGQMVATRMACPPPRMEIEQAYLRALAAVAAWRLADGTLTLLDNAGKTLLIFTRA